MIKLRLLCTFISWGADNGPKTGSNVKMTASRQRNCFVSNSFPSSKKQHYSKRCFLYWATKTNVHCLNWYRSRRLNIKLFAVVVYFCLVDCYWSMIAKMLGTERIKKAKFLCTPAWTSFLQNWHRWQRSLTCHGRGRIQFSCKYF